MSSSFLTIVPPEIASLAFPIFLVKARNPSVRNTRSRCFRVRVIPFDITIGRDVRFYNKGFIFEKGHEILTRGHLAYSAKVEKAQERLNAGNYLFNPAKFPFDISVRILSIIFKFIKSFKCRKLSKSTHKFQMLPVSSENHENSNEEVDAVKNVNIGFGAKDPGIKFKGKLLVVPFQKY